MKIVHVVNTYDAVSQEEALRNRRAELTWEEMSQRYSGIGAYQHCFKRAYGRSSLDIGDKREVPFFRDVVSSAGQVIDSESDIVMLTNADSCLVKEAVDVVLERFTFASTGAIWSPRLDVDKPMRVVLTQQQARDRGTDHRGLDLLAMTWKWWLEHRAEMPDTLLGYEGWDVIPILMLGDAGQIKPPIVYHEQHSGSYWFRNRTVARGNLWNRSLIRQWLDDRGLFTKACQMWKGVAQYRMLPEHKVAVVAPAEKETKS